MRPQALVRWVSDYRWPMGIVAILGGAIGANAVLLYAATRPEAARPMPDYYQRSLVWDQELAVREASRALGWSADFSVPSGLQFDPAMPRPVDLALRDRDGQPVLGVTGTLTAVRAADSRLDNAAPVTEIPHQPGFYRSLLRLPAEGRWEIRADLSQGEQRFVASRTLTVTRDEATP